ncbi:hypothetical protein DOK67_0000161 [Enterococcus sp. DIV0212c]|uniref:hypothetical protein n=1 Tax=Enterococcus sp. DIV0212c TaxID=2230867 RepID=UPI001A9B41AC|nr:hypothetical protein [Enterococcus sp. DIV0212c]MBO1354011.1 hypothetical protein [Enterococcus sp. DIV0212c]
MFGKKEKKKERTPDRFFLVDSQHLKAFGQVHTYVDRYTLVQYTSTHIYYGDSATVSSFSPLLDSDGKPLLYQEPEELKTDLDADTETDELQED